MSARFSTALVFALALFVAPLKAQSTLGTITGLITDSSGAVIPNAVVVATNTATGTCRLVEVHHICAQRFAWPERKRLALKAAHHSGQLRAGVLQVALHAHVHLQLSTYYKRAGLTMVDLISRCCALPPDASSA